MSLELLLLELDYGKYSREKRLKAISLVESNPKVFIPLVLELAHGHTVPFSGRAAWILEYYCNKDINNFTPFFDAFLNGLPQLTLDATKRPSAKICEIATIAHFNKKHQLTLSDSQQEKIIEACFDWLISDAKVAAKAYGMKSLYLLGNKHDWIHPELTRILERDYQEQSAAYKARARHITKAINKK